MVYMYNEHEYQCMYAYMYVYITYTVVYKITLAVASHAIMHIDCTCTTVVRAIGHKPRSF